MPAIAVKKGKTIANTNVTIVKKMRDYTQEPVLKKKAESAIAFIKKNGLPKSFKE